MKLSVVIPALNAESFIAEAIGSVLGQHADIEIIVADDGSTDRTAEIAAATDPRVIISRTERNEGVPTAVNRGLSLAGGELLAFLDADDLWRPGRLQAALACLAAGPNADAAWGRTEVRFMTAENRLGDTAEDWPPRHYPQLGSFIFRRRVLDRLGGFDPAMRHAHDIDFLARAKEAGLLFERHEDIVLSWRRHGGNLTNAVALDRDYMATAVRLALHRRKAARG